MSVEKHGGGKQRPPEPPEPGAGELKSVGANQLGMQGTDQLLHKLGVTPEQIVGHDVQEHTKEREHKVNVTGALNNAAGLYYRRGRYQHHNLHDPESAEENLGKSINYAETSLAVMGLPRELREMSAAVSDKKGSLGDFTPTAARALIIMGGVYMMQDDPKSAYRALSNAVELKPEQEVQDDLRRLEEENEGIAEIVKAEDAEHKIMKCFRKEVDIIDERDPEGDVIDLSLMNRAFTESMAGTLRDFKFYSEPESGVVRPELQMMQSLPDKAHPGHGKDYVNNWVGGFDRAYGGFPYGVRVEDEGELKWRFSTRIEAAQNIMLFDSVLGDLLEIEHSKDSLDRMFTGFAGAAVYAEIEKLIFSPRDIETEDFRTTDTKRESSLSHLRGVLMEHPHWLSGVEDGKEAQLMTDCVLSRIRNLNKMMNALKDSINEDGSPDLEQIEKGIRRIGQVEVGSRNHTEETLEMKKIRPSEFITVMGDVVNKIKHIELVKAGEIDPTFYDSVRCYTSGDLFELLEGLRVSKECLSYDWVWPESHCCIPEMLFSATAETLLLDGGKGDVDASLTFRLMPAEIEGQIEPVAFRQKVRALDDNHRYFLNDAFVRYAAASGATKIVAHSGAVGNPYALMYNRDIFEDGFTVEYETTGGETVKERISFGKRRKMETTIKYVQSAVSSDDAFHSHLKREHYGPEETLEGVTSPTLNIKGNFWVIDINREPIE